MNAKIKNLLYMYRAVSNALDVHRDVYADQTALGEARDTFNGLVASYVDLVNQKSTWAQPITEMKSEHLREFADKVVQLSGFMGVIATQHQDDELAQKAKCTLSDITSNAWQEAMNNVRRLLDIAEEYEPDLVALDGGLELFQSVFADYTALMNGSYVPFKRTNMRRTINSALRRLEEEIRELLTTILDPLVRYYSDKATPFYAEYTIAREAKYLRGSRYNVNVPETDGDPSDAPSASNPDNDDGTLFNLDEDAA